MSIYKVVVQSIKRLVEEADWSWSDSRYGGQVKDHSSAKYVRYSSITLERLEDCQKTKDRWKSELEVFETWQSKLPAEVKGRVEYRHPNKFDLREEIFTEVKVSNFEEELYIPGENEFIFYINVHRGIRGWYINQVSHHPFAIMDRHDKFERYGYLTPTLNTHQDFTEEKDSPLYKETLEFCEEMLAELLNENPDNRYSILDWTNSEAY